MYFGQSMPWPLKASIFAAAVLTAERSGAGEPAELPARDARGCFYTLLVFMLACVLPSLCHSVRCRRETTAFVSQSMLMLCAIGTYMAVLYARDADSRLYACASMLVLCTHFLYMVFRALSRTPTLLHFGGSVAAGSIAVAVLLVGVLVPRLPAFRMHSVLSVALLFLGELLGLGVFVVDAVVRAIAEGVEEYCG